MTCFNRSSAVNARSASPALPLKTLQEVPDETSETSLGAEENGATMIPRVHQERDIEGGREEETTPLKTEESTSRSGMLENHTNN